MLLYLKVELLKSTEIIRTLTSIRISFDIPRDSRSHISTRLFGKRWYMDVIQYRHLTDRVEGILGL